MNRRDLKSLRALIRTPIQGTTTSVEAVQAKARAELSVVSDTYSTASLAADMIRAQLAHADNPKDIATLTRALRDVMSILTDARQEARDTVASMQGSQEPQAQTGLDSGEADSDPP